MAPKKARTPAAHQQAPRLNLPSWLRPKLSFLLSKAENGERFFDRIGEIFPCTDERYKLIRRAYDTAKNAFRHHTRDSGERYFEHLRAATLILIVYLRVRDAELIAAMLLHDIVEDVKGWTCARVESEFGERVAEYVYWMTKPNIGGRFKTKDDVDRKYHRQLRDAPREAILLKACDRLHNLITMWRQEPQRMRRKISETKDFILPLLEMHQILIHEVEDVLRLIERRLGRT